MDRRSGRGAGPGSRGRPSPLRRRLPSSQPSPQTPSTPPSSSRQRPRVRPNASRGCAARSPGLDSPATPSNQGPAPRLVR
ncbi:MAG: hypothetical protein H6693_11595 [Candidatus Latescibacteria bacterium]|nr:hypothetical protein [Candidatus Latescibacterota bacterium]